MIYTRGRAAISAPVILLLALSLFLPALASAEGPRISLITIQPGKALYSSFGHTAIRVIDDKSGQDVFYNYGLSANPFDLRFALRMLTGNMAFMVGVLDAGDSIAFYSGEENRTIIEQTLTLDPERRDVLLALLQRGARRENREYNYRYFTDNCTTRPAVILQSLVGDQGPREPKSLRASVSEILANRPVLGLAIDFLLGPRCDEAVVSPIFLPKDLMQWAAGASYQTAAGKTALVGTTSTLYEAKPAAPSRAFPPVLAFIALLLLAILASAFSARLPKGRAAFDVLLFALALVPGLAILVFWLSAGYVEAGWNLNLLWASPLPIIALILGSKSSLRKPAIWLFRVAAVLAALVAVAGGLGLQLIPIEARLFAAAVALRCAWREGVLPLGAARLKR
jgi:hypothetical protein